MQIRIQLVSIPPCGHGTCLCRKEEFRHDHLEGGNCTLILWCRDLRGCMAHIPNVNSSQSQDFKVSRVCDNPGNQSAVHLWLKPYNCISEKSRLFQAGLFSCFNFYLFDFNEIKFSSLNSSKMRIYWDLLICVTCWWPWDHTVEIPEKEDSDRVVRLLFFLYV